MLMNLMFFPASRFDMLSSGEKNPLHGSGNLISLSMGTVGAISSFVSYITISLQGSKSAVVPYMRRYNGPATLREL